VKARRPERTRRLAGPAAAGEALDRPWARTVTVMAQDPSVKGRDGKPLLARIAIPAEKLEEGPRGYRVSVVDYDATHDVLYAPFEPTPARRRSFSDPYRGADADELVRDPRFHSFNTYALAMRTLAHFEMALGRRVPWGFDAHVLKIAPHAFAEANAFFSPSHEGLLFGYFASERSPKETIFTSLSHDVVVHETTHALLAGLRSRYLVASSPDQTAFHEAFADIVALLSVFSLREVVDVALSAVPPVEPHRRRRSGSPREETAPQGFIPWRAVEREALVDSVLLGLADQMGSELAAARGDALRRSARLSPEDVDLDSEEYEEPHRRGEVLVSAVLAAFLDAWRHRLADIRKANALWVSGDRVADEGADAAGLLLTMVIRALDYLPPVHVSFADFLTALLTADHDVRPDDSRYRYREKLVRSFDSFGISPVTPGGARARWGHPEGHPGLDRSHFESLTRDPIEVYGYIWENARLLNLHTEAHTEVISVRPSVRKAPDGFALRETIAEYVQVLKVKARELDGLGIRAPKGMPPDTDVYLDGGTTLIFDEYGRLKFAVGTGVTGRGQTHRLAWKWKCGEFDAKRVGRRTFSRMHRSRALGLTIRRREAW
jgi:hypothetical protein